MGGNECSLRDGDGNECSICKIKKLQYVVCYTIQNTLTQSVAILAQADLARSHPSLLTDHYSTYNTNSIELILLR